LAAEFTGAFCLVFIGDSFDWQLVYLLQLNTLYNLY
jgi:hypothetical protein